MTDHLLPIRAAMLALFFACPTAGAGAAEQFRGEYSVSLWGLTVARSTFTSSFEAGRYSVEGTVSSAGLAKVFDSTRGVVSTSGSLSQASVHPATYRMQYKSGRRAKSFAIDFSGDRVARTDVTPAPKPRGADWVALDKGDLARVADPLAASLVRAGSLDEVCTRTLRVYDGQSRMDLKLSPAGRGPVSIPGYEGETITCKAAFVPVSGYRNGHSSIEFLKNRSNIRITFAPLGGTGVYAPVRASMDTKIGTVTVRAERYGPA